MEIVHFAPFAPNSAGIYEAARDMVRADTERGHLVSFVDTGPYSTDGTWTQPVVGGTDDRGGFLIATLPPMWADTADLLIYHTGVNDSWVVRTQAPILMYVHGRPAASFRPEQELATYRSYSLNAEMAEWPRIKKMVYFWPEFNAYWRFIIPDEKRVCLDWPPIDLKRFSPNGPVHVFEPRYKGKINALICDSWRKDIDIFELTNGAIEAARRIPGLKIHFYCIATQPGTTNALPCWELLFRALRSMGALGEISTRVPDIEHVMRAVDFVMSPHRIITRIIGEALAVGTPVLAANGCRATPWTADINDPDDVASTAERLVTALRADEGKIRRQSLKMAQNFSLENFGKAIEPIYRQAAGYED